MATEHNFAPDVYFCERCGVSMEAVVDRWAPEYCLDAENVVAFQPAFARRQISGLVNAVLGGYSGPSLAELIDSDPA